MALELDALARNLKKSRIAKGLTQQQLAEQLSLTPQSISKWERGQAVPELDKLCIAADVLGISVGDLLGSNPGTQVLMGIDGGGTKSEFILFTRDGTLLKRLVLGGTNPNQHGLEHSLSVLRTGIDRLLEPGMDLGALYIGCAGFLSGGYGEKIQQALEKLYPYTKIACSSDIMNIIACASNTRNCIAAICGTGAVTYANVNRRLHRLGGAGFLLDTQGSGFDIGRDVLQAALREEDGIGEKTLLTSLVEKQLGSTVWDAIGKVYQEGNAFVAKFAPLAFTAYEKGDKLAEEILRKHARYQADLIRDAAMQFDCGKTVVLSGGIFTGCPVFVKMLKEYLPAGLWVEVPAQKPVYGACLLACELLNLDPAPFTKNFSHQYLTFKEETLC